MPPGLILLIVIAVGALLALAVAVTRRPSNRASSPEPPTPSSNSSGLFAEPAATSTPRAQVAQPKRPAPMPTTSGTGKTLTYLLQSQVPNQGWVTGQKSSGQLSAFGVVTATDDELPGFAKSVIARFDNGTRKMRIVFFRGELSFSEIGIENAYGDVTPSQGEGFSPWIFIG